jgi:hypothetical protein
VGFVWWAGMMDIQNLIPSMDVNLTMFEFDEFLAEYNCPIDIKWEFLLLFSKEYWGSVQAYFGNTRNITCEVKLHNDIKTR